MDTYNQEVRIEDEMFEGMRTSVNVVLQKLLKNMVEKGSMTGKITITLDVTLDQEFIVNRDPKISGETRRILTPKFAHKIGSVMQIKDEAKGGKSCESWELVWDEEKNGYVLVPIANSEQMSIWDADFKYANDESNEENEVSMIEGAEQPALPGPVEEEDMSGEFDTDSDNYGYDEPNDIW